MRIVILLVGKSGTGKSSILKNCNITEINAGEVNSFQDILYRPSVLGITSNDYSSIKRIQDILRGKKQKVIVFIDDYNLQKVRNSIR